MRGTALSLHVDTVTVEVAGRLRDAGVRSILLKGPAIASWLYADGSSRPYGDTDLLVAPDDVGAAGRVLRTAGFRRKQPGWQELSYSWFRRSDESTVDLHSSLFGVTCAPDLAWQTLSAQTDRLRVSGEEIEVLGLPARVLHVALHVAQHGGEQSEKPRHDLERALSLEDHGCWEQAARLAERLEATPAFAAGLRLDSRGERLAERMGLPDHPSPTVAMHAEGAQPLVLGLQHLATSRGVGPRLRLLARKLVPAPGYLRAHSALARRGAVGLALAYVLRPLRMLLELPAAVVAWRRARRPRSNPRSAR